MTEVAAFSPFANDPGRTTSGWFCPYPDATSNAPLAVANGRLLAQPGPTENSYMRVL